MTLLFPSLSLSLSIYIIWIYKFISNFRCSTSFCVAFTGTVPLWVILAAKKGIRSRKWCDAAKIAIECCNKFIYINIYIRCVVNCFNVHFGVPLACQFHLKSAAITNCSLICVVFQSLPMLVDLLRNHTVCGKINSLIQNGGQLPQRLRTSFLEMTTRP